MDLYDALIKPDGTTGQPCYKRQKKIIPTTVGAFLGPKNYADADVALKSWWRYNYGSIVLCYVALAPPPRHQHPRCFHIYKDLFIKGVQLQRAGFYVLLLSWDVG